MFEGDLVGFLVNEIEWIEITHRPKKIKILGEMADGIKIVFLIS